MVSATFAAATCATAGMRPAGGPGPAPTSSSARRTPSPGGRPPIRWTLLKAAVALGLLSLLAFRLDWSEFGQALGRIDPMLASLGALILLAIRLLTGYKWYLLVRKQVPALGLARVMRLTFVSDFLTSFLPSGIGTDTTRAWLIARAAPERVAGVSSVVADRLVGTGVLLLLGALAVLASPVPLQHRGLIAASILGTFLACTAGLILLLEFRDAARRAVERLPRVGGHAGRLTSRLLLALNHYRSEPGLLARAALLALAMNGLRILMNYVFALSLGADVSLRVHAAFVPLIFALNQLPVSIDALGVRETSYVYLYGLAGVPVATALAIALLSRGVGYVLMLPGAVLYVVDGIAGESSARGGARAPGRRRKARARGRRRSARVAVPAHGALKP